MSWPSWNPHNVPLNVGSQLPMQNIGMNQLTAQPMIGAGNMMGFPNVQGLNMFSQPTGLLGHSPGVPNIPGTMGIGNFTPQQWAAWQQQQWAQQQWGQPNQLGQMNVPVPCPPPPLPQSNKPAPPPPLPAEPAPKSPSSPQIRPELPTGPPPPHLNAPYNMLQNNANISKMQVPANHPQYAGSNTYSNSKYQQVHSASATLDNNPATNDKPLKSLMSINIAKPSQNSGHQHLDSDSGRDSGRDSSRDMLKRSCDEDVSNNKNVKKNRVGQDDSNLSGSENYNDEETQFDKQFQKWEDDFNNWRAQNANHPDKKAYTEYEMKFMACRNKLLERREQMRTKRQADKAKTSCISNNNNSIRPNQTDINISNRSINNSSASPQLSKTTSSINPLDNNIQPILANNQKLNQSVRNTSISNKSLASDQFHLQSERFDQSFNSSQRYQESNISNYNASQNLQMGNIAPLAQQPLANVVNAQFSQQWSMPQASKQETPQNQFTAAADNFQHDVEHCEKTSSVNTERPFLSTSKDSSFIKSTSSGGIPGLDLVAEKVQPNVNEVKDVMQLVTPNITSDPTKPDMAAISRGIKSILGDPKLLSMLSLVQTKNLDAQQLQSIVNASSETQAIGIPDSDRRQPGMNNPLNDQRLDRQDHYLPEEDHQSQHGPHHPNMPQLRFVMGHQGQHEPDMNQQRSGMGMDHLGQRGPNHPNMPQQRFVVGHQGQHEPDMNQQRPGMDHLGQRGPNHPNMPQQRFVMGHQGQHEPNMNQQRPDMDHLGQWGPNIQRSDMDQHGPNMNQRSPGMDQQYQRDPNINQQQLGIDHQDQWGRNMNQQGQYGPNNNQQRPGMDQQGQYGPNINQQRPGMDQQGQYGPNNNQQRPGMDQQGQYGPNVNQTRPGMDQQGQYGPNINQQRPGMDQRGQRGPIQQHSGMDRQGLRCPTDPNMNDMRDQVDPNMNQRFGFNQHGSNNKHYSDIDHQNSDMNRHGPNTNQHFDMNNSAAGRNQNLLSGQRPDWQQHSNSNAFNQLRPGINQQSDPSSEHNKSQLGPNMINQQSGIHTDQQVTEMNKQGYGMNLPTSVNQHDVSVNRNDSQFNQRTSYDNYNDQMEPQRFGPNRQESRINNIGTGMNQNRPGIPQHYSGNNQLRPNMNQPHRDGNQHGTDTEQHGSGMNRFGPHRTQSQEDPNFIHHEPGFNQQGTGLLKRPGSNMQGPFGYEEDQTLQRGPGMYQQGLKEPSPGMISRNPGMFQHMNDQKNTGMFRPGDNAERQFPTNQGFNRMNATNTTQPFPLGQRPNNTHEQLGHETTPFSHGNKEFPGMGPPDQLGSFKQPAWKDSDILSPSTVVDYGHKTTFKDSQFLEPVQTFDYGHSSKNSEGYPPNRHRSPPRNRWDNNRQQENNRNWDNDRQWDKFQGPDNRHGPSDFHQERKSKYNNEVMGNMWKDMYDKSVNKNKDDETGDVRIDQNDFDNIKYLENDEDDQHDNNDEPCEEEIGKLEKRDKVKVKADHVKTDTIILDDDSQDKTPEGDDPNNDSTVNQGDNNAPNNPIDKNIKNDRSGSSVRNDCDGNNANRSSSSIPEDRSDSVQNNRSDSNVRDDHSGNNIRDERSGKNIQGDRSDSSVRDDRSVNNVRDDHSGKNIRDNRSGNNVRDDHSGDNIQDDHSGNNVRDDRSDRFGRNGRFDRRDREDRNRNYRDDRMNRNPRFDSHGDRGFRDRQGRDDRRSDRWEQNSKDKAPQQNKITPVKLNTDTKPVIDPNVVLIDDILLPPGREHRPSRILIVMRGPPGSGKTFVTKLIKDAEVQNNAPPPRILSIDDYFMVETEVETVDDNGKKIIKKEMKYEYDEALEPAYWDSMMKSFKKTITDGFFNFIIVDCINNNQKHYHEMWTFAKRNNFQVYVCPMEMDLQVCAKRNVHNRTEADISAMISKWFPTPRHHFKLDVTSLLQSVAIREVEMEDVFDDDASKQKDEKEAGDEEDVQVIAFSSKWDTADQSEDHLARLDGISKPLRHHTIEDYLGAEWDPPVSQPGKKRVRWADIEEGREQDKMRKIGFVVGQTDWNRMMDPTNGQSALTQTKYIERVCRK